MSKKIIEDDYLGGGVYASFDGYHIVLDLRGWENTSKIALEPSVLGALFQYRERVNDAVKRRLTRANER